MPRNPSSNDYTVTEGQGCVVLRKGHNAFPLVAQVLGEDIDADDGTRTLWLDRRVHQYEGQEMGQWTASGAISTRLRLRHQVLRQDGTTSVVPRV